jgi:hypothetical protein
MEWANSRTEMCTPETPGAFSDHSAFTKQGQVANKCQLNRSMQHHPTRCFDNAFPGEPICLTALGENLARVAFRLI